MIEVFRQWGAGAPAGLAIALDVAIKSTVLIALAIAAHLALRSRFVLAASVVWSACLVSLLVLPIAVVAFPSLRIDCLPSSSTQAVDLPPPTAGERATIAPADDLSAPAPVPFEPGVAPATASIAPVETSLGERLVQAFGVAYLVGVVFLLIRVACSLRAVTRLRRQARPLKDSVWNHALEGWRIQLGLPTIALGSSSQMSVPVVTGWWRPMILIPESMAMEADRSRIDAVLLHELAHVRRNDYFWNLFNRLVEAIYWLHPLVWLIRPALGGLRERACDDFCIRWLGDRQAYRTALLDVAVSLLDRGAPGPALGMAMARNSRLAGRLDRIGRSGGSRRCVLGRASRWSIGGTILIAASLLGMLRLAPVAMAQEPKPEPPQAEQPKAKEEKPAEAPIGVVRWMVDTIRPGVRTITQAGSVRPFAPVAISARITGFIEARQVEVGDLVKKGQLLARIAAPELSAQLEVKRAALARARAQAEQAKYAVSAAQATTASATAKVDEAIAELDGAEKTARYRKKQFERLEQLHKTGAVDLAVVEEEHSKLDAAEASLPAAKAHAQSVRSMLQQAKSEVGSAEAGLKIAMAQIELAESEVKQLEAALNSASLTSPIDGIVLEIHAEAGALVRPDDPKPLFVIAASNKVSVMANIPDSDAPLMRKGLRATFQISSLGGPPLEGKITRLAWAIDPVARALPVYIDLDNPEGRLRPGMYGTVTIELDKATAEMWLPQSALVSEGQPAEPPTRAYCYRVVDGKARKTPVVVGEARPGAGQSRFRILEGLKPDDEVIVDGRNIPEDGTPVTTKRSAPQIEAR